VKKYDIKINLHLKKKNAEQVSPYLVQLDFRIISIHEVGIQEFKFQKIGIREIRFRILTCNTKKWSHKKGE